ncbi:hypothetical protein [Noviherbaspirillum saxi]|uniref:Alpha/beta hydrolase n=1 Tax=Noviherbaspirillum saxi TaxID=2320863 RepID=A0A3A3FM68_9BURK|nr:hypothetical protein [Noviherbaspirillum saxi]RJF92435.1 hypothetical protein D3871_27855 [Noviherbaspirillum saxi]
MHIMRLLAGVALVNALAACSSLPVATTATQDQSLTPCPAGLEAVAKCYTGVDDKGSHYWIAIPNDWNRTLVMHAHGGPRLSAIGRNTSLEDLERFAVTVRQGYAWAGSSYRRPGYGVRMAAEDTETLRRIFVNSFGKPAYTILHGQSWGGNIAAKGIELYARNPDGTPNYDGVVLTNGMVAGGSRNYLHRADLRAVYQYYCKNHPKPDEPQYPLWMGLPADSNMSSKDLAERVKDCTGVGLKAEQRTEQQKRNLANILGVISIPERSLVSHLNWATFLFRDLTQRVLNGRNPFSNRHVVYRGSSDDTALNRNVPRFDADPVAVRQLSEDSDMTGDITVPVISMHAINDPTAMVEYESDYKRVVANKGNAAKLVQVFTTESEHSKLADAEYAAVFDAVTQWIKSGAKPSSMQVAALCEKHAEKFSGGCHFDTKFTPASLFKRVAARNESSTDKR